MAPKVERHQTNRTNYHNNPTPKNIVRQRWNETKIRLKIK